MANDSSITVGDLVTWRADMSGGHEFEVGVVVNLEARGDDDSRLPGAWVKWAGFGTGWSPTECLVPLVNENIQGDGVCISNVITREYK